MKPSLTDKVKADILHRDEIIRTEWRFWASEASCVIPPKGKVIGSCLRRQYYQWKGEKITDPVSDWVRNLAEIGNFLEEKTRREFRKKGIYPEEANDKSKRKFKAALFGDAELSAEVDILIEDGKERAGVEVKSYSNSTYKVEPRPKDNHLLQAFLYSYFYEPKQDYFIIYYRPSMISEYATKDLYHRIEWVEIGDEIHPVINGQVDKRITISGIIGRFKELKSNIENDKLPKRDFTKSSKACQYCPYKTTCWKSKD